MEKLTPKEHIFVSLLVSGKSQRIAYALAGYSTHGLKVSNVDAKASYLLSKPHVSDAYQSQIEDLYNRAQHERIKKLRTLIKSIVQIDGKHQNAAKEALRLVAEIDI